MPLCFTGTSESIVILQKKFLNLVYLIQLEHRGQKRVMEEIITTLTVTPLPRQLKLYVSIIASILILDVHVWYMHVYRESLCRPSR